MCRVREHFFLNTHTYISSIDSEKYRFKVLSYTYIYKQTKNQSDKRDDDLKERYVVK